MNIPPPQSSFVSDLSVSLLTADQQASPFFTAYDPHIFLSWATHALCKVLPIGRIFPCNSLSSPE